MPPPSDTSLPRWSKGEPLREALSAARLNRPLDAIDELSRAFNRRGVDVPEPVVVGSWWGRITDAAPAGATAIPTDTPQYWVVPQRRHDDATAATAYYLQDEKGVGLQARRATNTAELSPAMNGKGCRLLSPGELVLVTAYVWNGGVPTTHYAFSLPPSPVRVRITDASGCGKGHYNGTVIKRPTADIDKSADLTDASLGGTGPACIVRNRQEVGRESSDPWLTHADNASQKAFDGTLVYVNSDGTPVIEINAAWFKICEGE